MNGPAAPTAPKKHSLKSGIAGFAIAVAITAGLTAILHARVALSEGPPPKNLLTVATTPYQVQDSYQRPASNLGLIVAGRKANLGFEIPGLIDSPPLRQGSPVSKGDVIATLDRTALESRRVAIAADLEQARIELELAQLRAKRQGDLQATGAVSKEAFDDTRLRARALSSQVDAVAARLQGVDIELEKSRLLAPYDGIIADRYIHQGAVVSPGTPVVRLLEIASQEAHIGVSAASAGELKPGNPYSLKLRDSTFPATLLSVRPDVDPVTRATTAVFAIPQEINALDGESVTLELEELVMERGGWLPIAALLEGKRGVWTVLTIVADGKQHRTAREAVEVLYTRDNNAFVRGTLAPGSQVVANGVHRISPGALIELQAGP